MVKAHIKKYHNRTLKGLHQVLALFDHSPVQERETAEKVEECPPPLGTPSTSLPCEREEAYRWGLGSKQAAAGAAKAARLGRRSHRSTSLLGGRHSRSTSK
jgi:hypothetical protein